LGSVFRICFFFPSLISGPIDKARWLVPQLERARVFDYSQAADGMRQILWGLFKKVVVANNCAAFVTVILLTIKNYHQAPAAGLLLYAFQLYADFAGYQIWQSVFKFIGTQDH